MGTTTITLESGDSAYIGAVSSRSSYTVLANSGVQGPVGNVGVSVTSANIVSNNLILTLSNTSTINVGSVVGPTGANGANGTNGTNGVSITNANIVSGNLVLTFSNSSTLNVGSIVANNIDGFAIGYRDVPQNFTNTSFTLALTDAGKHILTQNSGSSTQTITIANNTTAAFQTGAAITIVVQSTGTVAVANGAGVTMYLAGNSTAKSTVTLNSYSMATLLKIGTDTWMVSGTGAT